MLIKLTRFTRNGEEFEVMVNPAEILMAYRSASDTTTVEFRRNKDVGATYIKVKESPERVAEIIREEREKL